MGNKIDRLGKRYGRLVVTGDAPSYQRPDGKREAMWVCLCDCGEYTTVHASSLSRGNTKSCGCLCREVSSKRNFKHGLIFHPLYKCWSGMKARCYNKNHNYYCYYGGKGIEVCERWRVSFEDFFEDMYPTWEEGLTLDRRDGEGCYTLDNCRWATSQQQVLNRKLSYKKSSPYFGVKKANSKKNPWMAVASAKYLGLFPTQEEAAKAYDARARELWGDAAVTNFKLEEGVL